MNRKEYIKDGMKVKETITDLTPDNNTILTPWGTTVKANVLDAIKEYRSLSPEIRLKEKPAWIELMNSIMKTEKKIVNILIEKGEVVFVFRDEP